MRRHAAALSASHCDAVGIDLLERYLGEVADDIGQVIRSGIADLVKKLLTDRANGHTATRVLRFGHHDRTVCSNLGNGIAHLMEGVGHLMPVGVVTTGGLRPALDQVAGERTCCQQVQVITVPAKPVNTSTQRDSTVDAAAGHDNISALIQRLGNGKCTEIGVGTGNRLAGRCGLTGKHLCGLRCQDLI